MSGSTADREPAVAYPTELDRVHIGVTTKDEIRRMLGDPTDIRLSSDRDQGSESWAYANANPSINPFQYVPLAGVFAVPGQRHRSSFSISFSPDGVVDGITLRDVQPLGESWTPKAERRTTSGPDPYGRHNPLTRRNVPGGLDEKADDRPVGTGNRPVSADRP